MRSALGLGGKKVLSFYLQSHNVRQVTVHQLDTCHKYALPRGLQAPVVSQTSRFFPSLFRHNCLVTCYSRLTQKLSTLDM